MTSSFRSSPPPSVFGTVRTAFHKRKVARTARKLLDSFGESAWLEAGRRQLKARSPAQTTLWRDVAAVIVLELRAARDARTPTGQGPA